MNKEIDSKLLRMMLEKLIGDADGKDGAAIISVDTDSPMDQCDEEDDEGDHEYRDGGSVNTMSDGWKDGGMVGCSDDEKDMLKLFGKK